MLFSDVVGQEDLKKELKKGVLNGRIPHCQLFISREGTGVMVTSTSQALTSCC